MESEGWPVKVEAILQEALHSIGDFSPIQRYRRVHGGDINDAFYVQSEKQPYFIKMRRTFPHRFFECEQTGLETIRNSGAIRVPLVYGMKETKEYGFLVLEWIEGKETNKTAEQLGHGIALLHQCCGSAFGFAEDNYIGLLPQKNGWCDNWIDYFRECRLLPQLRLAEQKGRMPAQRRNKLEKLLSSLERWLPKDCSPSLLHGDLWGGNWIVGANGVPYLIDPAVFYGHYEFEIAFTELFGGFPSRFYEAYNELMPLSSDYHERKQLYQLFYLLVHLNLFGEAYGSAVDRVLRRYVGE
ncbi:fructosamine kinase family protein [Saccharococcus caldoxylosilyticus]|uniref:fructosamine kinase family protein n=1 Tax=Saccharococcus caldoxylosilyticus TaxID=81408 RepID=UPI00396486B8